MLCLKWKVSPAELVGELGRRSLVQRGESVTVTNLSHLSLHVQCRLSGERVLVSGAKIS